MENRIKDQQLDLFAGRASCHRFWANQFRQLLSGLAYTLIEGLRRLALSNTALATVSPNRIRLTLLRIGAVVVRNTRRIRLMLSSAFPRRRCSPGHLLTVAECCPGTPTKNGGWGKCLGNPVNRPRSPFPTPKPRWIVC